MESDTFIAFPPPNNHIPIIWPSCEDTSIGGVGRVHIRVLASHRKTHFLPERDTSSYFAAMRYCPSLGGYSIPRQQGDVVTTGVVRRGCRSFRGCPSTSAQKYSLPVVIDSKKMVVCAVNQMLCGIQSTRRLARGCARHEESFAKDVGPCAAYANLQRRAATDGSEATRAKTQTADVKRGLEEICDATDEWVKRNTSERFHNHKWASFKASVGITEGSSPRPVVWQKARVGLAPVRVVRYKLV